MVTLTQFFLWLAVHWQFVLAVQLGCIAVGIGAGVIWSLRNQPWGADALNDPDGHEKSWKKRRKDLGKWGK